MRFRDHENKMFIRIASSGPRSNMDFFYKSWEKSIYTAHKKFMNTSTSAESVASFILEGRYLENQTT